MFVNLMIYALYLQRLHNVFCIIGAPDAPVILRTLTKSTAVSVNLVWLSGFNGGFTQTFTVICKPEGSENLISKKEFTDPGYQKQGEAFVGNLNESSEYRFTVLTQNRHSENGQNSNKSKTEIFKTKGKTGKFRSFKRSTITHSQVPDTIYFIVL